MSVRAFFTRPAWRGVWLGLACALASWALASTSLFRGLEDWMLDGCFSGRGTRPTGTRVVLIGLDEPSLRDLGKSYAYLSPELAQVVHHAKEQGASAIGIDLMVPQSMSTLADIATPGAPGDARPLGQAIRQAGNVVLPEWLVEDEWQKPLMQWQVKALDPQRGEPTDFGFANLTEDGDQFVRRQQLLTREGDQAVPQFALALYARSQGEGLEWDERGRPVVGGQVVPLEEDQFLRINYVGPPGTFRAVPFREALAAAKEGRAWPEVKGAVVLIGVTARTQQDYHATPYANLYTRWVARETPGLMAGTEIQANILATLHDRAFIHTPWWLAPLPLLLVFGVVLGWCFARLNLAGGLLLAVGHHFAWKGLALAAFSLLCWRIQMVPMLLLGFLTYSAAFALRWRTLRRMMGVVKSEAVALALESTVNAYIGDPG
jgi:CHASE2 domain-containing sensor protein